MLSPPASSSLRLPSYPCFLSMSHTSQRLGCDFTFSIWFVCLNFDVSLSLLQYFTDIQVSWTGNAKIQMSFCMCVCIMCAVTVIALTGSFSCRNLPPTLSMAGSSLFATLTKSLSSLYIFLCYIFRCFTAFLHFSDGNETAIFACNKTKYLLFPTFAFPCSL